MSSPHEIRCKHCHSLLAKHDRDGLAIRRGPLQAIVTGSFSVAITCYRCQALNVLSSLSTQDSGRTSGA